MTNCCSKRHRRQQEEERRRGRRRKNRCINASSSTTIPLTLGILLLCGTPTSIKALHVPIRPSTAFLSHHPSKKSLSSSSSAASCTSSFGFTSTKRSSSSYRIIQTAAVAPQQQQGPASSSASSSNYPGGAIGGGFRPLTPPPPPPPPPSSQQREEEILEEIEKEAIDRVQEDEELEEEIAANAQTPVTSPVLGLHPPPSPEEINRSINPIEKEEQDGQGSLPHTSDAGAQATTLDDDHQTHPSAQNEEHKEEGGFFSWIASKILRRKGKEDEGAAEATQDQEEDEPRSSTSGSRPTSPPVLDQKEEEDDQSYHVRAEIVPISPTDSLKEGDVMEGQEEKWGMADSIWGLAKDVQAGLAGDNGGLMKRGDNGPMSLEGEKLERGYKVGKSGEMEVYEKREATAKGKKWSLQIALDVSLRFLYKRNQANTTFPASVEPPKALIAPSTVPEVFSATQVDPEREAIPLVGQELYNDGRGGGRPVAARRRGRVGSDEEEEVKGRRSKSGSSKRKGGTTDSSYSSSFQPLPPPAPTPPSAAALRLEEEMRRRGTKVLRELSSASSSSTNFSNQEGQQEQEGEGEGGEDEEEGEGWLGWGLRSTAGLAQGVGTAVGGIVDGAWGAVTGRWASSNNESTTATSATTNRMNEEKRRKKEKQYTSTYHDEALEREEEQRGSSIGGAAEIWGKTEVTETEVPLRKRDRIRQAFSSLFRPMGSEVTPGGSKKGKRRRERKGRGSASAEKAIAEGLGLTESEALPSQAIFGNIGVTPELGPFKLRRLGKRERLGIILRRSTGRPMLRALFAPSLSPPTAYSARSSPASTKQIQRRRRVRIGNVIRYIPYLRLLPRLTPFLRSIAPGLVAKRMMSYDYGGDGGGGLGGGGGRGAGPLATALGLATPEEGALPVFTPTAISQYRMIKERDALFPPFILAAAERADQVRSALAALLNPPPPSSETKGDEEASLRQQIKQQQRGVDSSMKHIEEEEEGWGGNPVAWVWKGGQGLVSWVGSSLGGVLPFTQPAYAVDELPPAIPPSTPAISIPSTEAALPAGAAAAAAAAVVPGTSSSPSTSNSNKREGSSWTWGMFSFFFPSSSSSASSTSTSSSANASTASSSSEGSIGIGLTPQQAVGGPLYGGGGGGGVDRAGVVTQGMAFDGREQDWYLTTPPCAYLSDDEEGVSSSSSTSLAISNSREQDGMMKGLTGGLASLESGMASSALALLAHAQSREQFRLVLQEAGGLTYILQGLATSEHGHPYRAQALESLCRLMSGDRGGGIGAGDEEENPMSSSVSSASANTSPGPSPLPALSGTSDDDGGIVLQELIKTEEIQKEVVRTLLTLIEAPLGLGFARLAGLGRYSSSSIEELRCQRAAIHLLYELCLGSESVIEIIQTEGQARLIPALQQIMKERLYEESTPSVYQTIHKLLTTIGYHEWIPRQPGQKGLRILCLDGGGTRGVMTIALLKHLIEATGLEVHELFDIVCGTSTGGILAALFAVKRTQVHEAGRLYDELIKKIFSKSPAPLAYSNLVLRTAQYNENIWEDILKVLIGETLLIDSMGGPQGLRTPKFFVLSSVLSCNPAKLFMWRNYNYRRHQRSRYDGDFRSRVREAVRATTAAPTYFYPLVRKGLVHSDGALLANNPTAIAIHEAKILYPNVPIEAVVSFGTGNVLESQPVEGFGWAPIFNQLINSATNTEAVHDSLADFLPSDRYFRFNPNIDNMSIDEVRPQKLQYLKSKAKEYFQEKANQDRLEQLTRLLLQKASPPFSSASKRSSTSSSRGARKGNEEKRSTSSQSSAAAGGMSGSNAPSSSAAVDTTTPSPTSSPSSFSRRRSALV